MRWALIFPRFPECSHRLIRRFSLVVEQLLKGNLCEISPLLVRVGAWDLILHLHVVVN